jgi:peptidoglycan/xylan/chitin deacetylase (PgdA/CDA1 family)
MSPARCYTILLYHGVHGADEALGLRNSSGKHIAADRFAAQMRHLAATRPLVSMRAIAAAYRGEGEIADGAVAVTFDDGFRNNYRHALPVLERYGVPATVYVATGFIGSGRMSWTDQLESALLRSREPRLDIETGGSRRSWPLDGDAARLACLAAVKTLCKAMPYAEKDTLVDRIIDALGVDPQDSHPIYAFMDWNEVRAMAASPLIDFGAHTVDHVALAKVPVEEMRRQIDLSVAALETELQRPCAFFSYPEGQEDDYNTAVIGHLRQRGFDHCPTAIHGENLFPDTGAFDLRRIMVGFQNCPYPFAPL